MISQISYRFLRHRKKMINLSAKILTPALQVEEPTANQRLFDEVTALSQELIIGAATLGG